jgi:hypothetical protein
MNNVYNDPAYQNVVKELKRELKRLQAELGDDPQDTGENPRLKQYFQTLNKEELKVMVAALLRGWEMETPPVPPNKKGIDVMAVMDPMEAESGTFKVQINHLTTDHDVQNLINQLQPQKDAGFILSLDGLSPEAEKLAKQTGVRLELVDLNWFVSMWEETYPEMSKKDRALIPFDPYKVQVKR